MNQESTSTKNLVVNTFPRKESHKNTIHIRNRTLLSFTPQDNDFGFGGLVFYKKGKKIPEVIVRFSFSLTYYFVLKDNKASIITVKE